ncbi:MAG: IS256 family transposase [Vicinamibacteria bacterium]
MSSDPKPNVSQNSVSDSLDKEIDRLLAAGLEKFSVRELLGMMLSAAGQAERRHYLTEAASDKGNGSYGRSVNVGSIPVDIRVPRSRTGNFRPSSIPPPYERGYSEEIQALLFGVLSSARSINAAKTALQTMGLGACSEDLDAVASGFVEELELVNSRPIDPDMLAVFLDGKYVEVKEDERLRSACIYLVIGLHRDGKKKVLGCYTKHGRENLEGWKTVLRSLVERGLRRVLIIVHDDFSGLLGLTRGMFPNSDVQLCTVHMLRNAKTHLSKDDSAEFTKRFRTIKQAWNAELAGSQFEELCQRFEESAPAFVKELRQKRPHYLFFLNYPDGVRRTLSTTNAVEAINKQLEILRRNSGGYFHSEETAKLKLGIAVTSLESGRWRRVAANVTAALDQFNAIFEARFETE